MGLSLRVCECWQVVGKVNDKSVLKTAPCSSAETLWSWVKGRYVSCQIETSLRRPLAGGLCMCMCMSPVLPRGGWLCSSEPWSPQHPARLGVVPLCLPPLWPPSSCL